jgi:hypothetical protein
MEVSVQTRFRQLTPGEKVPYARFTGSQVSLKTSLDAFEKRKIFSSVREKDCNCPVTSL